MTRFTRVLGLALLLSASARAAEHDWPAAPRQSDTGERVSVSLSNRAGLVKAPFVTTAFPEVSGFGMVLTGAAAVRFSSLGWLRLKLPVSFAWLDFPAGAQVKEAALGNLELGLEHPLELGPATRLGLLAAILVPSAEEGPEASLLADRALALGSALSGGKDAPLLTPNVTGLRLGASIEHTLHPLELRASLDLPLLVRTSDGSLPEDTETHPLGFSPAVDLRAGSWLASWFGASLGVALITEPWRVEEPALERDRKRRLELVVEPGVHFQVGQHVGFCLDASVPVGGNLGGNAWSIGTRARLGL